MTSPSAVSEDTDRAGNHAATRIPMNYFGATCPKALTGPGSHRTTYTSTQFALNISNLSRMVDEWGDIIAITQTDFANGQRPKGRDPRGGIHLKCLRVIHF